MKIPIYKINTINTAIATLADLKLPVKVSWSIYKISNELSDKLKFIGAEEKKIIEKYNGILIEGGNLKFPDGKIAKEAFAELNSLHTEELDCDITPIEIAFEDLGDCKIEPKIFAALDEIIDFKEVK